MTTEFREIFARDTDPGWKGSYAIEKTSVPVAAGLTNGAYYRLFSANCPEFRERRLVVSLPAASQPGTNYLPQNAAPIRAGVFGTFPGTITTYGSLNNNGYAGLVVKCTGYGTNTLFCDVRSGTYRIPPCTNVEVSLLVSRHPSGAIGSGIFTQVVNAALVDSCEGPTIRPTQSISGNIPGATDGFTFFLNPLARWIDIQGVSSLIGTATNPIFSLHPGPFGGPTKQGTSVFRNYVAGTWFPTGDPVEIFPGSVYSADQNPTQYAAYNSGTIAADFCLTQFLEW